ncbi:RNA 2'-phosphotransferase [Bacillus sp. FJAT-27445]|uniref:RNA 2'-phosphotransferase n=1 Tax=Bacillus sp. FJAT-27445 TaxID=1679166 RepID=UPI000743C15A|nr:RNA 2'-phosphotransferase [Bacillus sp. FJAT-27445]
MDYRKLSKEMSYALRHAPWEYELELDNDGWVSVEQVLNALQHNSEWVSINESDLRKMIEVSDKERHQIQNGRIRALYGHSVPQKILKKEGNPPPILFHGTARRIVDDIFSNGLQPMARQYVHLSIDVETANLVGKRKDSNPVILKVNSVEALMEGIKFYQGNNDIWLADSIPPKFISVD